MKNYQSKLSRVSFKQAASLFLLGAILLNSLTGAAQTKSAVKTARNNAVPTIEKPSSAPVTSPLGTAWKTGELPAPLAMPDGNTDEVAAILARKVAAKNQESVPALLTALILAGFFVTDKNGQVLHAPPDGRGQGLPINGWEVASVARMYGDNRRINLAALDGQLQSVPVIRGFPATGGNIGAALVEGVRANADNARNPYLRVWARFIIELGKNSEAKYDLANGATAAQINLDAIQHLLMMRRLYGDFRATAEKFRAVSNSKSKVQSPAGVQIVKASFEKQKINQNSDDFRLGTLDLGLPANDEPAAGKNIPCRMDGNAPTVMDAGAAAAGAGYDKFLGVLEDSNDAYLEKFGSKAAGFTTIANILLAYAKFIQTYAALETKITAEDSAPLIRTKNAEAGARKKLRAEVRLDIGNWQMYNCIRTALNVTTGIDFSTMNDGPLGDVGVQWGLTQGGAGDFYSNETGINEDGEQIVGFAAEKSKRIQDGTARGITPGNLTFTKTDDKGIAENILEGTPQKNAKIGKVTEVPKKARVVTSIKIKAGEIKGDFVDVAAQAIDGVPGLIAMPTELLYRTSWAASGALDVPVTDWQDCNGDWAGTVTLTKNVKLYESKTEKMPSGRGESTRVIDNNWDYTAVFNVVGKDSTVLINSVAKNTETRDTYEEYACHVTKPMRRMSCKITSKFQTKAIRKRPANVRIVVNRNTELYGISGAAPDVPAETSGEESGTCSGQCVPKKIETIQYDGDATVQAESFSVADQKMPASNAVTLNGTQTLPSLPGITTTVTWNLRFCGAQANLTAPEQEGKKPADFYAQENSFDDFNLFDALPARRFWLLTARSENGW